MFFGEGTRNRLQRLKSFRKEDRGFAEVTAAIFILPLLIAFVFTLIELGWYLRYRSMVDEVTRYTTVMAAADGADRPTSQGDIAPWSNLEYFCGTAPGGCAGWSSVGTFQLAKLCGTIPPQTVSGGPASGSYGSNRRCSAPPAMTCTPNDLQSFPSDAHRVICTSRFNYQPLTSIGRNPILSLGFSNLFTNPIEVTVISTPSTVRGR